MMRSHVLAGEETAAIESPEQIVSFPYGLPGFADCRRFVVYAAESANYQWLTSVQGPLASFLTVDPRHVLPTLKYKLTPHDLARLQATEETELLWLAIVLIEPDSTLCVNLRAPIVINPLKMIGGQIMPERSLYPLRHVISPAGA